MVLISLLLPTAAAIGAFWNTIDLFTAATVAGERHTVDRSSDMVVVFYCACLFVTSFIVINEKEEERKGDEEAGGESFKRSLDENQTMMQSVETRAVIHFTFFGKILY